jgi:hypothetical protein
VPFFPADKRALVQGNDSISLLMIKRQRAKENVRVVHVASGHQWAIWIAKIRNALAAVKDKTEHVKAVPAKA